MRRGDRKLSFYSLCYREGQKQMYQLGLRNWRWLWRVVLITICNIVLGNEWWLTVQMSQILEITLLWIVFWSWPSLQPEKPSLLLLFYGFGRGKTEAVLHVVFHLIPENSVLWWSHFGYDSREVVNSLNFYWLASYFLVFWEGCSWSKNAKRPGALQDMLGRFAKGLRRPK